MFREGGGEGRGRGAECMGLGMERDAVSSVPGCAIAALPSEHTCML